MDVRAFFAAGASGVVPQPFTRGPWDAASQHGGPVAAILGREIERCEPRDEFFVARVTVEILRPVPLQPLEVSAHVARGGRNVEMIEAVLHAGDVLCARATAWRLRAAEAPPDVAPDAGPPEPGPGSEEAKPVEWGDGDGYWSGMDWRFARGSFAEPGPALSWLSMRVPLVDGEQPTPLQRTLIAADVGNGISNVLDFGSYYFINTDLTVNLHRPARGEWIGVDARTVITPGGAGLAESVLSDQDGAIGRAVQTLYVAKRS